MCIITNACGHITKSLFVLLHMYLTNILIEVTLIFIISVAEIPDVQYELTLRNDVIQQVLLLASSPMSSSYDLVGCMSFLVCLSRCKKGHSNLLKTGLIDEIIGLCSAHEEAQGRSISKCSEIMVLK